MLDANALLAKTLPMTRADLESRQSMHRITLTVFDPSVTPPRDPSMGWLWVLGRER